LHYGIRGCSLDCAGQTLSGISALILPCCGSPAPTRDFELQKQFVANQAVSREFREKFWGIRGCKNYFRRSLWKSIFLPDVPLLEIIFRVSAMYIALFVLLQIILKPQMGSLRMTNLLLITLITDASDAARAHAEAKEATCRLTREHWQAYARVCLRHGQSNIFECRIASSRSIFLNQFTEHNPNVPLYFATNTNSEKLVHYPRKCLDLIIPFEVFYNQFIAFEI
jgi:hypothetical protein